MSDSTTERETTGRRIVNGLGSDKLHKGINWTTLAGSVALAVMGQVSDAKNEGGRHALAGKAAEQIAVLRSELRRAQADLREQGRQIDRLRDATAASHEALAVLSSKQKGAAPPVSDLGRMLISAAPDDERQSPADDADAQAADAEGIKRSLLGEP